MDSGEVRHLTFLPKHWLIRIQYPAGIDSDLDRSIGPESGILHSHPLEDIGPESTGTLRSDPLYSKVTMPDQTNVHFQELIATANDKGVVYTSPKGKEKEVASKPLPLAANEHGLVPASSKGKAAVASSISDYCLEDSGSAQLSVLMVGVQCPDGRYSHAVFQVFTPSRPSPHSASALDLYQSLRSSEDAEVILANLDINDMDSQEIRLATARLPIFMDELPNYSRSKTGFRHMGFLQELDPNYLIKPVLGGEEKEHTLEVFGQDPRLDIYVLYILTEVSLSRAHV
jgi:hypothetical protein